MKRIFVAAALIAASLPSAAIYPTTAVAQSAGNAIFETCVAGLNYQCTATFDDEQQCLSAMHRMEADLVSYARNVGAGRNVGVGNLDLYYYSRCEDDGSGYVLDVRIPLYVDGDPSTSG